MPILISIFLMLMAAWFEPAYAGDVCHCMGYSGPGGPCFSGPGGPAYDGPGGPAYSGPGGPCYAGPGGPSLTAPVAGNIPDQAEIVTTALAVPHTMAQAARRIQDQAVLAMPVLVAPATQVRAERANTVHQYADRVTTMAAVRWGGKHTLRLATTAPPIYGG